MALLKNMIYMYRIYRRKERLLRRRRMVDER